MIKLPLPGDVYLHTKTANRYRVSIIARMSADQSLVVVYAREDDPYDAWVRPLADFIGFNDDRSPRFTRIEDAK